MRDFIYNAHPARVIFGAGTLSRLSQEADRLGLARLLVLSTPEQEGLGRKIAERLGPRCAGTYSGATMHTPVVVTEHAMEIVAANDVDGLVSVGGGSTIGLGKAIALRTDLPQIAIPTTYAGSEMTPIIGQTEGGVKTTHTTPKVLPEVVLYDVELTVSLPPRLSGTSGMNAVAHAIEALYAQERNPIISLIAIEGIKAMTAALPEIATDPVNRSARSNALYGAWLCGICLGSVGMSLHHKLCHTLGGSFDLPHSETHTILLPHTLAYNAPSVPEVIALLREALHVSDPMRMFYDVAETIGAPKALRDLGMREDMIDLAADLALEKPYWNPRPLDREAIRAAISRAWSGQPPQA